MVRARSNVLDDIRTDCDRQRPHEACGFLMGFANGEMSSVIAIRPTDNVWPVIAERDHRFAIDPLMQMKAERTAATAGLDLVGFYHSHPTALAVPSQFDLDRAWPRYVYLILGYAEPGGPTPRAWTLDAGGAFVEHRIQIEETV